MSQVSEGTQEAIKVKKEQGWKRGTPIGPSTKHAKHDKRDWIARARELLHMLDNKSVKEIKQNEEGNNLLTRVLSRMQQEEEEEEEKEEEKKEQVRQEVEGKRKKEEQKTKRMRNK